MLTRRKTLGLGLAACGFAPMPALAQAPPVIRFGLTPVFLDNDAQILDEFRRYLRDVTGAEVQFTQRRTYKEVVALLILGDIDVAWLCGYPLLQHANDIEALAMPVWRGGTRYQSYLIVPQDSAAARIEDLRGGIHAYSDPDSNSGYLVTVSELLHLGHKPETFFSKSFFTFGHRNVTVAVARRLADSGSVDGYVWEALVEEEPELAKRTRIIWRSEWFGFPPICVPRALASTPVIQRLRQALFAMQEHPTGQNVLRALHLDGFAPPAAGEFDSIARRMQLLSRRG